MKIEASEPTVRSMRLSVRVALTLGTVACLFCPPARAELQPDTAELQPAPEPAPAKAPAPAPAPAQTSKTSSDAAKPAAGTTGQQGPLKGEVRRDNTGYDSKNAGISTGPNSNGLIPGDAVARPKRRPWGARYIDETRIDDTMHADPRSGNVSPYAADPYQGARPAHAATPSATSTAPKTKEAAEPEDKDVSSDDNGPDRPRKPSAPSDEHRPFRARYMDYTRSGDNSMPGLAAPGEEREYTRDKEDKEKPDPDMEEDESALEKAERQSLGEDRRNDIDPVPHYRKALGLTQEKKYKEALEELDKALERNLGYSEAQYQVAFVHQLMGDNKVAIKEFKKYLRVKPEDVQAHINLGALLKANGDPLGAVTQYRKAIEIHYFTFIAHYNLANVLVEQGLLEDGQKEYQICLKLKPTNAMVHNNLGVIYQRRNYLEEANEEFQKASRLEPNNPVFHTNISLVRAQMHKEKSM